RTGTLVWTLNDPAPVKSGQFGFSVSLDGDGALVGAPGDDTNVASAYLFDVATGLLRWTFHNPTDFTPMGDGQFGWSVALNGDRVLVGAPSDSLAGKYAGAAYLFDGRPFVPRQ